MDLATAIAAFVAGGGLVSFIWHCGMYAGQVKNHLARHDDQLALGNQRFGRIEGDIRELQDQ